MKRKSIIIELIKQDLHFNQYLAALRNLGIELHTFDLNLMSLVARLMGRKKDDLPDDWMDLYVIHLSRSKDIPYDPLGKNLNALARECYYALLNFERTTKK